MADQIKELIEKIQAEGVGAGQEKARVIEEEARLKAEFILQKANAQAASIIEAAKDHASRMEASSHAAIQQSGRDVLLTLKKEILSVLQRVVAGEIAAALKPEELANIILAFVKIYGGSDDRDAAVYLSEADKKRLEAHFSRQLSESLKKGITLRCKDDVKAGFIISFDGGKSHFDFTDKALADYIGSFLNPAVTQVLNGNRL